MSSRSASVGAQTACFTPSHSVSHSPWAAACTMWVAGRAGKLTCSASQHFGPPPVNGPGRPNHHPISGPRHVKPTVLTSTPPTPLQTLHQQPAHSGRSRPSKPPLASILTAGCSRRAAQSGQSPPAQCASAAPPRCGNRGQQGVAVTHEPHAVCAVLACTSPPPCCQLCCQGSYGQAQHGTGLI